MNAWSRALGTVFVAGVVGLGVGSVVFAQKEVTERDAAREAEDQAITKKYLAGDESSSKGAWNDSSDDGKNASPVKKSARGDAEKSSAGMQKYPSFDKNVRDSVASKSPGQGAASDAKTAAFSSEDAKPNVAPPMPYPSSTGRRPVPARYRIVTEKNLFRKLGWAPPAPQNPFTLIGVVNDGRQKRALLARQGSGMGIYASVGESVGQGYTLTAIEQYSVRLTGGALGTITCELDREMIGAMGGGQAAPMPSTPTKTPMSSPTKKKYYPARGARFENVVREILEREGISWQEVESNKDLQQKLKSKYQYLEDEGYVTFPKD